MKLVRVYVTAEDIAKGRECLNKKVTEFKNYPRSENCAIALALQRTFNTDNAWWAYVTGAYDGHTIMATKDYEQVVSTFVSDHDLNKDVHPFSFTIKPLLGMGASE